MAPCVWKASSGEAIQKIQEKAPEIVSRTLQEADATLAGIFTFTARWDMERCTDPVSFPAAIDWEYRHQGDDEWCYQLNRHGFLLSLARAWRYSGARKYLTGFQDLITDWMDRCPLTEQSRQTSWRSLEVGIRIRCWLLSLQMLEDDISHSLLSRINDVLNQQKQYLKEAYSTFHKISNWGVLQDEGLFLLAVRDGDEALQKSVLERLSDNLETSVLADGSHWEQSPMYTGEVLACFLSILNVALQHDIALPAGFAARIEKMATALTYFAKSSGILYAHGDSDTIDARDLFSWAGVITGNAFLKSRGGDQGLEYSAFMCTAEQVESYEELQPGKDGRSVSLPDSGHAFLRGQNLEVHFSCGPLGSGHGHADQLHVDVVYRGEDVLIDSGRYTYRETLERLRLKEAGAHNTPILDGSSFTEATATWGFGRRAIAVKKAPAFYDGWDYASGGHLGYLASHGVYVERKVIRLGEELVIFIDVFHTSRPITAVLTSSFHLDAGTRGLQIHGSGASFSGRMYEAQMATINHGVLKAENTRVSHQYNELLEAPVLRTQTDLTGSLIQVAVLALGPPENGQPLTVQEQPVLFARKGPLPADSLALGFTLAYGGSGYTVMVVESDLIGEVDLYSCAGIEGYGRLIVAGGPEQRQQCLEW